MHQLQNLIKTGRINRAQRIVICGPNALAKTTLASRFPAPIIIDTEDGSTHQDVTRIQTPDSPRFFEALRILGNEEDPYQTLVIDTIDVGEKLLKQERVLKRLRVKNIEDIPYGKGWWHLREEFESFLTGCLDPFIRRGIHVIVVGHSTIRRIQPPGLSDAYDRFELKLDPTNSSRLREWADAVLFLNWDIRITENAEGRVRGVGGKERVVYTTHCASFDAKNRVGLPEKVECSFAALAPLLGDTLSPESQPENVRGQPAPSPVGVIVPELSMPQDDGATSATPQQRLAQVLHDQDPEAVRLFLLNRKVCTDGRLESAPDDYAIRALEHLPRFKERLTKFVKEPF